jgi:hypothetical protein
LGPCNLYYCAWLLSASHSTICSTLRPCHHRWRLALALRVTLTTPHTAIDLAHVKTYNALISLTRASVLVFRDQRFRPR